MPPLSEEELMAMYAATLFPEMLSTAGGKDGIGRTTQTQLLNPDLIASLGLFGPEQITAGLQERLSSAEQKAMQEWMEEGFTLEQKIVAEQASQQPPVFINEIKNRYESNPSIWAIVGSFFDQIEKGTLTASQAQQLLDESRPVEEWTAPKEEGGYGLSPEVAAVLGQDEFSVVSLLENAGVAKSDLTRLRNDLSSFEDDASTFRSQKLQWEYSADDTDLTELLAQKAIWDQGPKGVDIAKEKLDYFKDIGVPGLALLPDPSELPQVSVSDVRKPRQAGTDRTLAESQLLSALAPASGKRDVTIKALEDLERDNRRAASEAAVRAALPPKRDYTPAEQAAVSKIAKPATKFYDIGPMTATPTPTPLRRTGGYQAPSAERDLARYLEWEQKFYQDKAQREARRRASKGDTPFMNALRALQTYGVEVG